MRGKSGERREKVEGEGESRGRGEKAGVGRKEWAVREKRWGGGGKSGWLCHMTSSVRIGAIRNTVTKWNG